MDIEFVFDGKPRMENRRCIFSRKVQEKFTNVMFLGSFSVVHYACMDIGN